MIPIGFTLLLRHNCVKKKGWFGATFYKRSGKGSKGSKYFLPLYYND
jgi:hypothetical protein